MKYLNVVFLSCAFLSASHVSAQTIAGVTNFRALFAEAIDSKGGKASAQMQGPMAEKMKAELKTTANIFVDVAVVAPLRQPGCKRLSVKFSAPESKLATSDGGVAPLKDVGFELNVCRDGSPPRALQ